MTRWALVAGAVNGFVAVAAGAFAAHGLRSLPDLPARYLDIFETAARYQMYHALALVLVGLLPARRPVQLAATAFTAGIIVFSGTLYALALTRLNWLGAITPIGGVLMLAGWALLAWAGATLRRPDPAA